MINVLFICHGNICRSPLAEFILKALVEKLGLAEEFSIASAATSQEEIGNPIYPPVQRILNEIGIDYSEKRARQIKAADAAKYHYIIAMERYNLENLHRLHLPLQQEQLFLLRDFTENRGDIADPWYTRDFEEAYTQILEGCMGFLEHLKNQHKVSFEQKILTEKALHLR